MSDQDWAKEVADAVAVAERATGRSWWVDVLLTEVKKSQPFDLGKVLICPMPDCECPGRTCMFANAHRDINCNE